MNIGESSGKKSCNAREDGDAPTGSERPLKKARFAWQVKGKYHLKNVNETSHSNTTIKICESTPTVVIDQAETNVHKATNVEASSNVLAATDVPGATNVHEATNVQVSSNVLAATNVPGATNLQAVISKQVATSVQAATNVPAVLSVQAITNVQSSTSVQAATNVPAAINVQAVTNVQASTSVQASTGVQPATNLRAAINVQTATNVQASTSVQATINEEAANNELVAMNHTLESGGSGVNNPVNHENQLESDGDSESSSLSLNTSIFMESLWYPRSLSEAERYSKLRYVNKWTQQNFVHTEDSLIAEWQSIVTMKCCVDNTLNQAFERWCSTGTTQAANETTRHITQQVSEFINHFPGPNSVENEGIMMAISEHGLQNTIDDARFLNILPAINVSPSRNLSPVPDEPRSLSPISDDNNDQNEPDKMSDDDQKESEQCQNPNERLSKPHTLDSSYNENNQNFDVDADSSSQAEFDFMNTAILNAIQNKGLTVSGTEYG